MSDGAPVMDFTALMAQISSAGAPPEFTSEKTEHIQNDLRDGKTHQRITYLEHQITALRNDIARVIKALHAQGLDL